MNEEVHMPRVREGINPGGVWLRICLPDRLLLERPLNLEDDLDSLSTDDGELAKAMLMENVEVRAYFYDGDTGICMKTVICNQQGYGMGFGAHKTSAVNNQMFLHCWATFMRTELPPTAPLNMITDLRTAFYGGGLAFLALFGDIRLSNESALDGLHTELEEGYRPFPAPLEGHVKKVPSTLFKEKWLSFQQTCVSSAARPRQMEATRNAFYAGAWFLLKTLITSLFERGDESTAMQTMQDEISEFLLNTIQEQKNEADRHAKIAAARNN